MGSLENKVMLDMKCYFGEIERAILHLESQCINPKATEEVIEEKAQDVRDALGDFNNSIEEYLDKKKLERKNLF